MDNKTFRMETLQSMEQYLRDEILTRKSLKRRYSYIKNSVTVLNYTLLVVSLVVGATGVFAGPGIVLSGIASTASILNIICPVVTKKMQNKIRQTQRHTDPCGRKTKHSLRPYF